MRIINKKLVCVLVLLLAMGAAPLLYAQNENLIKNGDFEGDDRSFYSDFEFSSGHLQNGVYIITDSVTTTLIKEEMRGWFYTAPENRTGKYLACDPIDTGKLRVWYDTVQVEPNTTYTFSCQVADLTYDQIKDNVSNIRWVSGNSTVSAPPAMCLFVNGKKSSKVVYAESRWRNIETTYTTGPAETSIELSIVNRETTLLGNDVAIDNIVFRKVK